MPIRTHRGRSAVYRRFWGWPLRSPRHLGMAIIGLLVVATAVSYALPDKKPDSGPVIGGGSSITSVPTAVDTSATIPPRVSGLRTNTPSIAPPKTAAPDPAGVAVAVNWAKAWVNHPEGVTGEAWLEGLKPYTTDEFLPQMKSVDPKNVPASKVTGEGTAAESFVGSMKVRVPTDAGNIEIEVVKTPQQGWRVDNYQKV
ncbi:hypothetical protein D5S17_07395 [Pseudonocardiaceae bacterium YIM PH 21723]|nr:hypothetical protein D5S17_07395 [Pseudonocardiaceae bacterium YIM PH 21723]